VTTLPLAGHMTGNWTTPAVWYVDVSLVQGLSHTEDHGQVWTRCSVVTWPESPQDCDLQWNTAHNANPTNPNRYSKGNPNLTNPTNPTNPNTRYRCE